ncbi:MAG: DUF4271 domain-containing protein, partial [Prolixibacteraceae bacterium]
FIILTNQLVSLHPENMNLNYTYQPDSIKVTDPLKNLNSLPESQELKLERSAPVSLQEIGVRKKEKVVEQAKPAQPGRKNWRQQQQIPAGNEFRFIEPRNEVNLVASANINYGLHLPERPVESSGYDWVTLVLLVAVALFASVRTTWNKYLSSLFHSTVNYSTALRMYQEKNNSLQQGAFMLDVLFYIILSVFAFQVLNYFNVGIPYQNFYLYLFCLAGIVTYFLAKKTIYRFMGVVIEKRSETGEYLFNADNFKRVAGLILLPMVAVIAYYPYGNENFPVIAGMAVLVFLYSLLVLRGFVILLRKQFSIFYLFLYFCTLEFLPLVLLYKILVV